MSKCLQCYGSKVMMGGGFMQRDCDACDGTGVNLKSMAEEKAVKAICDDTGLSIHDAKKIYSDEFEKSKLKKRRK